MARSQEDRDVLKDLIRGEDSGRIIEPRCNICKSTVRDRVDRLAAAGFGATAIADEIMGSDPVLSNSRDSLRKNVSRHVEYHMNIKDKAIRRILEKRADEAGVLLDEYESQLVSVEAMLDLMVAKGIDQITDIESRIKYADAIEAAKMLEEIKKGQFAQQLEIAERQVYAISQAVKEIVSPDLFPNIISRAREIFNAADVKPRIGQPNRAIEV